MIGLELRLFFFDFKNIQALFPCLKWLSAVCLLMNKLEDSFFLFFMNYRCITCISYFYLVNVLARHEEHSTFET